MTTQLGLAALVSLIVGAIVGYALARLRTRTPAEVPSPPPYTSIETDDTRPTLVPFKVVREAGRKFARLSEAQRELEGDHLDQLMSEIDKRR